MSDTVATIFTAIAGGLFVLAVAYIGYRAGRRQATDHASVVVVGLRVGPGALAALSERSRRRAPTG